MPECLCESVCLDPFYRMYNAPMSIPTRTSAVFSEQGEMI